VKTTEKINEEKFSEPSEVPIKKRKLKYLSLSLRIQQITVNLSRSLIMITKKIYDSLISTENSSK